MDKVTQVNPITGSLLSTKPSSEAYREGWDKIFNKKGLKIVKVFPDYCSTGLWLEHRNVSLDEISIEDTLLEVALRNWHQVWELEITTDKLSVNGINTWLQDAIVIVQYMNDKYGDKFLFVNEVLSLKDAYDLV